MKPSTQTYLLEPAQSDFYFNKIGARFYQEKMSNVSIVTIYLIVSDSCGMSSCGEDDATVEEAIGLCQHGAAFRPEVVSMLDEVLYHVTRVPIFS